MLKRFVTSKQCLALAILAVSIAITPYLRQLAYEQRGYAAIGGECLVPVFAGLIAIIILLDNN